MDNEIYFCLFVYLMVFNATFNNISVISWWSVLLVEDPEKTTDLSQVADKLYHIMLYTSPRSRLEFTTSVVIGTDCIGICKSNYAISFFLINLNKVNFKAWIQTFFQRCTKEQSQTKTNWAFVTLKMQTFLWSCFFPRNFSDNIYKTFKLQIETRNFKWLNGSKNWNQLTNFMGSVVLGLKWSTIAFDIRGHFKSLKILATVNIMVIQKWVDGIHISKSRQKRSYISCFINYYLQI